MKNLGFILMVLVLVTIITGCIGSSDNEATGCGVSSLAYKGHQSDADVNNFVCAYPQAVGTRLDNCVLCHTAGQVQNSKGNMVTINACDYCHYIKTNNLSYALSLNPYGKAYADSGRSKEALLALNNLDSDNDTYSNHDEIAGNFFPGSLLSNPSKSAAPFKEFTLAQIKAMPAHTQFMLSNAHKQQFDDYVTYTGVRFDTLLQRAGVDLTGATGITVYAPDGYAKSYTMEQVTKEYPKGKFYTGLDDAGLGPDKGFVNYPDTMAHTTLQDGQEIPDSQYLILAYDRDFAPIPVSYIDSVEFRIQGEGPFRSVRPQDSVSMPDRGLSYPEGDQYDLDESFDHNAGDNVRGVTIIRVDPIPAQYEEFDALNAGWLYLEQMKVVIYGHGVE